MDILLSKLAPVLRREQACHFSRAVLKRTPIHAFHNHDYYEVFWIHHGKALHVVNAMRQNLSEGDIVFVRPGDTHGLQGKGDETHIVNVAIAADVVESLITRFPELAGSGFFAGTDTPEMHSLNSRELASLSKAALTLEASHLTRLDVESFLLPLLSRFVRSESDVQGGPKWIAQACAAAQSPEVFRQGAAGLVAASGRAHAHVSRMMRQVTGKSPSEFVNGIRMEHAARLITGGSDNLPDVAKDCGIENLSHFHRLFKAHHGMTPKAYRNLYQRDVIQPS